jgi:hypothetical protein
VLGNARTIEGTTLPTGSLSSIGAGHASALSGHYQKIGDQVSGLGARFGGAEDNMSLIARRYREVEQGNTNRFRGDPKLLGEAVDKGGQGGTRAGSSTGVVDPPGQPGNNGPAKGPNKKGAGRSGPGKGRPNGGDDPDPGGPDGGGGDGFGNKDTHHLGTHNGVDVSVDAHQNKHHTGSIFGLKRYTGGDGEKFPGHVGEQWHSNYFGPQAARLTNNEVANIQRRHAQYLDQAQAARQEASGLSRQRHEATQNYQNATDPAEKARYQAQLERLAGEYNTRTAQVNAAMRSAEQEQAKLTGDAAFHPSKDAQPDNVKYDITARFNPQTGRYEAVYHCNPNTSTNEARSERRPGWSWWENYGRGAWRTDRENLPGAN